MTGFWVYFPHARFEWYSEGGTTITTTTITSHGDIQPS